MVTASARMDGGTHATSTSSARTAGGTSTSSVRTRRGAATGSVRTEVALRQAQCERMVAYFDKLSANGVWRFGKLCANGWWHTSTGSVQTGCGASTSSANERAGGRHFDRLSANGANVALRRSARTDGGTLRLARSSVRTDGGAFYLSPSCLGCTRRLDATKGNAAPRPLVSPHNCGYSEAIAAAATRSAERLSRSLPTPDSV